MCLMADIKFSIRKRKKAKQEFWSVEYNDKGNITKISPGVQADNPSSLSVSYSKIQNILDKPKNDIKNTLDLKILKEKKLVNSKYKKLKILGTGEIKKNLEISAHFASKQALSKIEKAGGKISIIKK